MTWPFVGRTRELGRAVELLDAESAHTRFAVVDGEPGIGKTRLLHEIAERARSRDRLVLSGHATRVDRAAPYAMLLDALPEPLLDRGHRVFRAVRAHLAEQAGRRPVLLTIDDLHWADDASVELLEYLVCHPPAGPVLVLLAHRSGQCPAPVLRVLGRADGVCWLTLGPLDEPDTARLLPAESVRRQRLLHDASGGNPLYLSVLTESGSESPAEPTPSGAVLDRTVTAELRALGDHERSVVQALALVDGDPDPGLLACVAALEPSDVDSAVDALVSRDVLRSRDGRTSFRHPLVHLAADRLAGPGWRAGAHARAGDYLATHDPSPVRRARHLEHTATTGDVSAADVLATAARAWQATQPRTSARYLRTALRILPEDPAYDTRRARWRVRRASALFAAGQLDECRTELAGLHGLTGRTRSRAVRLLAVTARLLGDLAEARSVAAAELHRTPCPAARVELRFELAAAELLSGQTAQALTRAAGHRHPGVAAVGAVLAALGSVASGPVRDLVGLVEYARVSVDGLDDQALCDVLEVTVALAWLELLVDEGGRALGHLTRSVALARDGHVPVLASLRAARTVALYARGRVGEALESAEDAAESARATGSAELVAFAKAVRLCPLWSQVGPLAGTEAEELDRARPLASVWHQFAVDVSAGEPLVELGRSATWRTRVRSTLASPPGVLASTPRALLGLAHLADGDVPGARRWVDEARAGLPPLAGQRAIVAHVDAEVLLAEGRFAAAADEARTAVDQFIHCGQKVAGARARTTLAEASLRLGDVGAARDGLGRAKESLSEAGANWLAKRAEQAQRRLGARLPRPQRPAGSNGALTSREHEIAELVADGLTNRAIAARLYLSARTVDAHLARILDKLDVASRAGVARRLLPS